MSKITKSAKGEECTVRLPGICNHNHDTVVYAHYRLPGTCGIGLKPIDILGAYACSACHDEIDRRTRRLSNEEAKFYHVEGILRTQIKLVNKGLIKLV